MTPEDLAWAAGMFEGEGTVTIAVRRSDDTYRVLCMIGNTDRSILEFFAERWTGVISPATGPRPRRQPAWTWQVSSVKAAAFLRDIEPSLRTERVRAKVRLAIDFRDLISQSPRDQRDPDYKARQRAVYEQMRLLNLRGQAALDQAKVAG